MRNFIGPSGASALAAVLKETKISELECAAAPNAEGIALAAAVWGVEMSRGADIVDCGE